MDVSGRVLAITGAAGNLGVACVRAFHQAGAHILLADRSSERLRTVFPELAVSDRHVLVGEIDLSSAASAARLVDAAVARFGRLDGLVHTVGAYRGGAPVLEAPLEEWDLMLTANLTTTLHMCRAALKQMIRGGRGTIVNVASRHGLIGPAGEAAYAASKAGVIRLTEAISAENRRFGVNANCVLPGTLDTPRNREARPGADFSQWVDPASVADVIVFLSSSYARDLHGVALPVGAMAA